MLVEIPDPEIILGFIIAFFVGLFVLYTINKIKPSIKLPQKFDTSSYDRLEFYERQLIDMKIRLDSLDIGKEEIASNEIKNLGRIIEQVPNNEENLEPRPKPHTPKPRQTRIMDNNMVDFVLNLITDKSMTSRDIQNVSQRSREHTSRLMKKLFQEGYVTRDTKTKPYTYFISDKGKAKIGVLEYLQNTAA